MSRSRTEMGSTSSFLCALLLTTASAKPHYHGSDLQYELDASWKPQFPAGSNMFAAVGVAHSPAGSTQLFVTQRGNASIDPVLVVDTATGKLQRTFGSDTIWVDARVQPEAPTWGAHGLSVEVLPDARAVECSASSSYVRVWINDFTSCTIWMMDECGKALMELGTPGVCGNSSQPLLLGKSSDITFAPAPTAGANTSVFIGDGDGSDANRVISLTVPASVDGKAEVRWATGAVFQDPHGVAFHARSGLVVVADRGHAALRFFRAADGSDAGTWHCPELQLGAKGLPFAVRTFPVPGVDVHPELVALRDLDLVFVAIMDNPQDGKNQRIAVLNASSIAAQNLNNGGCEVLQEIVLDPHLVSGPHLLDVDGRSGDLYTATVAPTPKSVVWRYKLATSFFGSPIISI